MPSESVPALDAAMRAGMVEARDVGRALAMQSRSGRRRAAWALAFADPRSESVGESRSRVAIALLGFARPTVQLVIPTEVGDLRADFGWRLRGRLLLGEFDGMTKYGTLASASGRTPQQVLADEKAREDRLRRHAEVVRWTRQDVIRPDRLERILLERGLPQRLPTLPPGVFLRP